MFLYFLKSSGDKREFGVGLLLTAIVRCILLTWGSVSDKISTTGFPFRLKSVTIVFRTDVYFQWIDREVDKDAFYEQLHVV